MPDDQNPSGEITVIGPAYWADHAIELSGFLRAAAQGTKRIIADPSDRSGGQLAVIVDPAYWSAQARELSDAMRRASEELAGAPVTGGREDQLAAGAAATQDRLTMTVEEAAARGQLSIGEDHGYSRAPVRPNYSSPHRVWGSPGPSRHRPVVRSVLTISMTPDQ